MEEAREAILENADGLLQDALTLLNRNRYARSLALTVLAREELGKLAMIVRASYAAANAEPYQWPRLQDRMHRHQAKLAASALVEIILSASFGDGVDPKKTLARLLQDPATQRTLNESKQVGFYVGVDASGLTRPADDVSDNRLGRCTTRRAHYCSSSRAAKPRIRTPSVHRHP